MKKRYAFLVTSLVFLALAFLPTRILLQHYSSQSGFLRLLYFGEEYAQRALPGIQEISPPVVSQRGYDGQFYAQVALCPSLRNGAIEAALDLPTYRAQRIGLSFLAFCLGGGQSARVLHVYTILNFFFWLLLFFVLIRYVGIFRLKDILLVFALLWSTGTLASLSRALPDFPAVVLGMSAVFLQCGWFVPSLMLGMAGLCKEVSILSFATVPWRKAGDEFDVRQIVSSVVIVVAPVLLWFVYVHVRLPHGPPSDFAFPFVDLVSKLARAIADFQTGWVGASVERQLILVFEILCPLSLLTQATYLAAKPRVSSRAWRFGIGFVLLLAILNECVWIEQYAYARVFLPLTFAFNLLINKHETGLRFLFWYIVGNVGMAWLAIELLR